MRRLSQHSSYPAPARRRHGCGGTSTEDTGLRSRAIRRRLRHRADAPRRGPAQPARRRARSSTSTPAVMRGHRPAAGRGHRRASRPRPTSCESWGEKVPRTVRDHSFEHSTDDHDIPSLDGMPTGDDLEQLGQVPPAAVRGCLRRACCVSALETTKRAGRRASRRRRRRGRAGPADVEKSSLGPRLTALKVLTAEPAFA